MYITHVLCHFKGVNPIINHNHRSNTTLADQSFITKGKSTALSIKLTISFPPFLFPLVDIPNMSPAPLFSLSHHLLNHSTHVCRVSHLARIL